MSSQCYKRTRSKNARALAGLSSPSSPVKAWRTTLKLLRLAPGISAHNVADLPSCACGDFGWVLVAGDGKTSVEQRRAGLKICVTLCSGYSWCLFSYLQQQPLSGYFRLVLRNVRPPPRLLRKSYLPRFCTDAWLGWVVLGLISTCVLHDKMYTPVQHEPPKLAFAKSLNNSRACITLRLAMPRSAWYKCSCHEYYVNTSVESSDSEYPRIRKSQNSGLSTL